MTQGVIMVLYQEISNKTSNYRLQVQRNKERKKNRSTPKYMFGRCGRSRHFLKLFEAGDWELWHWDLCELLSTCGFFQVSKTMQFLVVLSVIMFFWPFVSLFSCLPCALEESFQIRVRVSLKSSSPFEVSPLKSIVGSERRWIEQSSFVPFLNLLFFRGHR